MHFCTIPLVWLASFHDSAVWFLYCGLVVSFEMKNHASSSFGLFWVLWDPVWILLQFFFFKFLQAKIKQWTTHQTSFVAPLSGTCSKTARCTPIGLLSCLFSCHSDKYPDSQFIGEIAHNSTYSPLPGRQSRNVTQLSRCIYTWENSGILLAFTGFSSLKYQTLPHSSHKIFPVA